MGNHYASPELHAVWDHVVYEFHKTLHVPLADTDWEIQGNVAARIMGTYPEAQIVNVTSLDPEVWAQESLELVGLFYVQEIEGKRLAVLQHPRRSQLAHKVRKFKRFLSPHLDLSDQLNPDPM